MSKIYKDLAEFLIEEIRNYFVREGNLGTKAIIGISGGKDSSVAAALCVKALGKENVLGVILPQGKQHDIEYAYKLVNYLDIEYLKINIKSICDEFYKGLRTEYENISEVVESNTPARVRMTMLYAVAAMVGGRVINTSNASERYIGYSTKWGDNVGDFYLLKNLLATDVVKLGRELGLPSDLVNKKPEDGLSVKTDEDNLGFTYEELDGVLYNNKHEDKKYNSCIEFDNYKKIMDRYKNSHHKNFDAPICSEINCYKDKEINLKFFYN